MDPLYDQVRDFFQHQQLLGSRGVVGVSGGPDSVALAHILTRLLQDGILSGLTFAHLNHQLRSADSDADEEFVIALSHNWNGTGTASNSKSPAVRTKKTDISALASQSGGNLEAVAREERYRFFSEIAIAENADWVATGHTADDQAETVLHRLLRGSGLDGLSGIAGACPLTSIFRDLSSAPCVLLIRPFLKVRRAEIISYLTSQKLIFRRDVTNDDLHFTRNRLRHELLPHLRETYNRALDEILIRLADQARATQEEITMIAGTLLSDAGLPRAGSLVILRRETLAAVSDFMMRCVFRLIWQRESWPMGDMNAPAWQRLVEVVRGKRTANDLPGGIRIRCVGGVIQIGSSCVKQHP